MRTILRILLWLFAAFAVLTVGAYAYLRNADLSVYEEQIEGFLSQAIGHKIDFDGLFELHFGNHTELTAEKIRLTNPDWQSGFEIASVGHLSVTVDLWSLVSGPIIVEELDVRNVRIQLEKNAEGQANWDPGKVRKESKKNGDFNADLIAFKEVEVEDVQIAFVDPARRRPLDVAIDHLTINPDESNILDLDLTGTINELAIWADGKLGPWNNFIDGKNITADLDLMLGQVRLSLNGSVEDLSSLTGVEITLKLGGPHIDRVIGALGLPPFAKGEFQVDGRIYRQEQGDQFRLEGSLGEIDLLAAGSADKLINTSRAQLDFRFSGPDTKYVAEVFGVKGALAEPFQVSGDLKMDGKRLEFSDTRAQVGDNTLGADGWIDLSGLIPNGDITINASGPDFSVVGPFAKIPGIPSEVFDIHGQIQTTGNSWRFDNVEVIVGANRIAANGAIGQKGSPATEINISASGPDISILQAMTGLRGIPSKPFNVSATIKPDPVGIRIENANGVFGDNRLEIDGAIATAEGLSGTNLYISGSGPELKNVALLTGVPYLPEGPFEFGGRVQLKKDELRLSDATAAAGGMTAAVSGTIGLGADTGEFDLVLSVNGPDIAAAMPLDWLVRLSGESLELNGRVRYRDNELELHSVTAKVGNLELGVDGEMVIAEGTGDVRVSASSPDLAVVSRLTDLQDLPEGGLSVTGRIEKKGEELEFIDAELRVGEILFAADGTLSTAPLSNRSDLRFRASGPGLDQLGRPFAVDALPAKPFTVIGEVNGIPKGFVVEELIATIGENNIDGGFTADLQDKPEVTGYLSSSYLDLRRRGQEAEVETAVKEEREFLFSDEPLEMEWLQSANVDVKIKTDRLMLPQGDLQDFQIGLKLWDGVLNIDPILFRESDGNVSGSVSLGPSGDSYGLDVLLNAENMHIGLLATEDQDRATVPPVGGHIDIKGSGNSLHELMASLNGEVELRQDSGQIRDFAGSALFGDLFLQVLRTLNPMHAKDEYRILECGIFDFDFTDGVVTIESLAVQTDKMTYVVVGGLNFQDERIRLSFKASPREGFGISIGSVANSFVRLGGTLQKPQLQLDTASSVTTTGAAVATGGLSLLAKGLWDRAKAEADICKDPQAQQ